MKRERILIVDPNPLDGAAIRASLCEAGYDAVEVASVDAALSLVPSFQPAAVLAETALPDGDVPALVARLRGLRSDAAVVVSTAPERVDLAVAALRGGAESWLVRPVDAGQALLVVEKALEKRALRRDGVLLRESIRRRSALVGTAPELQAVVEVVKRVAPTKATVLVQGESGTGKAHVAQALHEASPRRDRPFVRVNCAALSEVLLESELLPTSAWSPAPSATSPRRSGPGGSGTTSTTG
jgi:two-component system NtrC family response regulator